MRALLAATAALAAWDSPHLVHAQDPVEAPKRPTIAIESVAVVDVVRGEIASPRTVLIVDGRIAAIGEPDAMEIPPTAVRVDGRGRYLMPGLVDMHVHLFNNASRRPPNEWAFPLFVANGVTGVREMLTEPATMKVVNGWRTKVNRGELVAPRVLATGASVGAESAEATRRQVREAKAAGVDFIKIFSHVREPQWRAILEEARALRMPVCGHIPCEVSLLDAATAGQRSNEHLTQIYEACSPKEKELLRARKGLEGKEIVKLRDAQEQEVLESFDQRICDRSAAASRRPARCRCRHLSSPISKRAAPLRLFATIRAGVICARTNKRDGSGFSKNTRPGAKSCPSGAGKSPTKSSRRCTPPVCAFWPGPMRPCHSSIPDSRCTKSWSYSWKPG